MSEQEQDHAVGIIGTGTMGAGIAQIAATHGWTVHLMDVDEPTVQAGIESVVRRLVRLAEKGRIKKSDGAEIASRLKIAKSPECFADCELIIEAVTEDLDVKSTSIERVLPGLGPKTIIATNTSSLSITRIGEAIAQPARTVGMHFFNPAPLMKLVEIVSGAETDPAVVDRAAAIAEGWGKTVARARDVPGFIVNHVARPYYLEAFRIIEDGIAPPDVIDAAMTEVAGFRMGPLELTDMIGQDVNAATTRLVWEQLGHPPLLHPSRLQEQLVDEGHFGLKTGRGVYQHDTHPPVAMVPFKQQYIDPSPVLTAAVAGFCVCAGIDDGDRLDRYIIARIVTGLIVQAHHALARDVAERKDIDTALRFGANYPHGPLEWATDIGLDQVNRVIDALNATVDDDRFALPEGSTAGGIQA